MGKGSVRTAVRVIALFVHYFQYIPIYILVRTYFQTDMVRMVQYDLEKMLLLLLD